MAPIPPTIPPKSSPPLDYWDNQRLDGGGSPVIPLISTAWYLFFNSIVSAVATIQIGIVTIVTTLTDCVRGAKVLLTVGQIPKISEAGTLEESDIADDGTLVSIPSRHLSVGTATPWALAIFQVNAGPGHNLAVNGSVTLADGVTLNSFDDAAVVSKGMEFRASAFLFDQGSVGILLVGAPAYPLDVSGDINTDSVYRIGGTQVLGPQLGVVVAPSITTTTITATAGATYTATEQAMLASMKAAINQLNADVVSLQSVVNTLRSRLATTGITS